MQDHLPGSIWPPTGAEEEQIREVYSRYGLAMYMAQVLEHGMVNAEIVMRTLGTKAAHADAASWHAAFDAAYEVGLARTYGNMLKQIEGLDGFPPSLLARLRQAKEDRDVLAHRFFWQNDIAFMSPQGRTAMIAFAKAKGVRESALKSGEQSSALINYTELGELKDVILRKDNWEQVFEVIFVNRQRFDHDMLTLMAVRRPAAHARMVDSTQMLEALLVMKRLDDRMSDDGRWRLAAASDE